MHCAFTHLALVVAPLFSLHALAWRDDSWGNALIANNCGNNAYFVEDNDAGTTSTIQAGSTATVPMYYKAATPSACNPGGPSLKIVSNTGDLYSGASLTQFEFTPGDYTNCPGEWCQKDKVSCDISNVNTNGGTGINGNGQTQSGLPPFMAGGMSLSSPQDPTVNAECGSCVNPCTSFYTDSNDNTATHATSVENDIMLTLCSGEGAQGRMMGSDAADKYCEGGSSQQSGSDQPPSQQQQQPPTSSLSSKTASSPSQQPTAQSQSAGSSPFEEKLVAKPSPAPEASPAAAENKVPVAGKHKAYEKEDEVVVTVTAWAPTVTEHVVKEVPNKEKRQDHIHAHVHQEKSKRRHGA